MDWIGYITGFWSDASLQPAVSPDDVDAAERQLGEIFPNDIRDFLIQADGVCVDSSMMCLFGINTPESFFTVQREMRESPEYSEMYQPFNNLLFFASDGMGGFFARVREGDHWSDLVIHWDHEEDTRNEFSRGGLKGFLYRYQETGGI